jgi:polyphosphate kinase
VPRQLWRMLPRCDRNAPAGGAIGERLQHWVKEHGLKVVLVFEGRDAAGKGGTIKRLTEPLKAARIVLLKYWFSVSDGEQERRFQDRAHDSLKRWKLSPTDLKSREKWVDFSRAKDEMFAVTDIDEAPWFTVEADDKRRARLNCISHMLDRIDYRDALPAPMDLPPRPAQDDYRRPPKEEHIVIAHDFWQRPALTG